MSFLSADEDMDIGLGCLQYAPGSGRSHYLIARYVESQLSGSLPLWQLFKATFMVQGGVVKGLPTSAPCLDLLQEVMFKEETILL